MSSNRVGIPTLIWMVNILFFSFSPASLPAQGLCSGTAGLARNMVNLLKLIEDKLNSDEQQLQEGWNRLLSGVESEVERGSIARHRMNRASLTVSNRSAWKDEQIREAVLLRLATVDLAIDELAQAQLAEIRELEAMRASSLHTLIGLIRSIRINQQELLAYLEDKSRARRLGELNAGSIAAAVTQARILTSEIDGRLSRPSSDFETERVRIEEAMTALQRFLRRFEPSPQRDDAEGSEPPEGGR